MTNTNRINELVTQITAFSKEAYPHEALLPELLELQKQLIYLVFNDTHAEYSRLRIWDVENHLQKLNEECGHTADDQLEKVIADCKVICNMIKSEFSGNAGERKAFWSLETVRCKNRILKNVEFNFDGHRTELDAIMLTNKAVFVIEVKNPGKDIYIDERGNYCRVGDTMTFDKNIGERMNDKVFLLRKALCSSGIDDPNIVNIVVFTNNAVRVDNRYPYINTCFLSDLPHIIEQYTGETFYTDADIDKMVECVLMAECKETYPLPIDMAKFKINFATVVAMLEEASAEKAENSVNSVDNETAETSSVSKVEKLLCKKDTLCSGYGCKNVTTVAVASVALAFTGILTACICKALKK